MMPKITAAIHDGERTWYIADGRAFTDENANADRRAAESGQRIIRNPDGTCTIEDLPHEPTALELIEHWWRANDGREHDERIEVVDIRKVLAELRDAIRDGRHGGPT